MACFKTLKSTPPVEKFPHAWRWYKHISSYESEFPSLPGDPSKAYTTYGPEAGALAENPKDAPKGAPAAAAPAKDEDDDDDDLFGSDESEDEEAKAKKEANLAAYRKKKEGKTKPAAKSMITMDVKPWGMSLYIHSFPFPLPV